MPATFEAWLPGGVSVASLLVFFLIGLVKGWWQVKPQIDRMIADYAKAISDQKERYETHLSRTHEMYRIQLDDARRREVEWKDVGQKWQDVSAIQAESLETLVDQGKTMLAIVQSMQVEQQIALRSTRSGGRRS